MLLRRTRHSHGHRLRRGLGVGMGAVLALVLAGCGTEQTTVSGTTEPSESPALSSSPTEPSEPAEPSESSGTAEPSGPTESPAPSASATTDGPVALSDRLLTGEEMPGFNEEWTWKVASTSAEEGAEPFGTCHRFAMTSLGATDVAVRTFTGKKFPDEDAPGGNLVAEFPDGMTAKRAYRVLRSWRGTCEEQLEGYDRRAVHDFEPVEVQGGEAGWYLLIYGPPEGEMPDMGYFDAQGMVRVGRMVSLLAMRGIGQDYNYPAGEEPLVGGLRTAAAKLD